MTFAAPGSADDCPILRVVNLFGMSRPLTCMGIASIASPDVMSAGVIWFKFRAIS